MWVPTPSKGVMSRAPQREPPFRASHANRTVGAMDTRTTPHRRWLPLTLVLLLVGGAIACGGDDSNDDLAEDLRAVLTAEDAAYTDGNGQALRDVYSAAFLQEVTGSTDPEPDALDDEVDVQAPERLVSFELTDQADNTADAHIVEALGLILCERDVSFVMEGGTWKIDNFEPCIHDQTQRREPVLRIEMTEYSYEIDYDVLQAGDYQSLELVNNGNEPHMALLARIPVGADLEASLPDPPPGTEPVLTHSFNEPGETKYYVIDEALPAGRYLLLDPLPNADDIPGMAQGMITDFTIG